MLPNIYALGKKKDCVDASSLLKISAMIKKSLLVLFLILLALPALSIAANCDCPAQAKSVKDSYAQAGVVLVGTVQKFTKSPIRPGMNEAVIKVMSRYKGLEDVKANTIYVYTPDSKPKCGVAVGVD